VNPGIAGLGMCNFKLSPKNLWDQPFVAAAEAAADRYVDPQFEVRFQVLHEAPSFALQGSPTLLVRQTIAPWRPTRFTVGCDRVGKFARPATTIPP